MTRLTLSDAQWAKIEPYCAGKETDVGRTAVNNRLFIEAVLWIVRTGRPWRDLPPEFGNWNSVYKRCRRWVKSDRFSKLFDALNDSDLEYALIDGTIVRVHRHGQGSKKGRRITKMLPENAATKALRHNYIHWSVQNAIGFEVRYKSGIPWRQPIDG